MDRRNFIKVSALIGGGMMLRIEAMSKSASTPWVDNGSSALGHFLKITSEGDVHFQLTKHEMGQGVSTSLAMILAEELDADWNKIRIDFIQADLAVHQTPQLGGYGTGGSTTVMDLYPILRKAGASARALLVRAAADKWKVQPADCVVSKGIVTHGNKNLSFGELASDAARVELPDHVPLKAENNFAIVGKDTSGKLIPDIASGKLTYGLDAIVEGQRYAVVARCPVYQGKIKRYDASAALKVSGVRSVVTTKAVAGTKGYFQYDIREGVAVVADNTWAAIKGREALKVEWEEGVRASGNTQIFETAAAKRSKQRVEPTGFTGSENAIADVSKVKSTLRANYTYPYMLHSTMEPLNCTAHFKGDSCEVYVGSQAPHQMIRAIMSHFKLPQEKVKLNMLPSGGGFGRRWYPDTALEALCISKEAGNVPIKMVWTREDDQTVNHAHCFCENFYQASIDQQDNLYAWYQKELRTYTWGAEFANPELTWIGYDIPNIRYDFENLLEESLLQSCAWRSVVANAWGFGQECFIDEIAIHLKRDPLAFRISLLKPGREAKVGHSNTVSNDRLARVLKVVGEKSGWETKTDGVGKGIAAYPYMHGNSYCAMVAEVVVTDGKVKIARIVCAVDCGKVVNPSGVRSQMEGGVVWGLTALFYGGIDIQQGKPVKTNFHQNKLLRMDECPPIDIHFVESDEQRPFGIGELAPPVVVPAVLNAVFNATSKRVRKLPIVL